ncbi:hypothetical protein MTO96_037475 [Rhipicephalus appendiculatus]
MSENVICRGCGVNTDSTHACTLKCGLCGGQRPTVEKSCAVLPPGGPIFPLTVTRGTLAPTPAPELEAVRIPGVVSKTDPNLRAHPGPAAVPGPGARGAESRSRIRPDRGPGSTASEDPPKSLSPDIKQLGEQLNSFRAGVAQHFAVMNARIENLESQIKGGPDATSRQVVDGNAPPRVASAVNKQNSDDGAN